MIQDSSIGNSRVGYLKYLLYLLNIFDSLKKHLHPSPLTKMMYQTIFNTTITYLLFDKRTIWSFSAGQFLASNQICTMVTKILAVEAMSAPCKER